MVFGDNGGLLQVMIRITVELITGDEVLEMRREIKTGDISQYHKFEDIVEVLIKKGSNCIFLDEKTKP